MSARWIVAGAMSSALALSACGSSGGGTAGGGGTSGAANPTSASSSAPAATGTPIDLWMANMEVPQLSFENLRLAAQATVDYLNQERGGVDGHPLKLHTCITHLSPESTTSCATQIVQAKPVAIIGGADILSAVGIGTYVQSGIPTIGGAAFSEPDMQQPDTFRFSGSSAAGVSAMSVFTAKDLHAKKVAVLVANQVTAKQVMQSYVVDILNKLGVDVVQIPTDAVPADYTPIIADAASKNVDAIIAVPPGSSCVNLMQAVSTLASNAKLILPGICDGQPILNQAGSAATGVYFSSLFATWNDDNADRQLFEQKIAPRIHESGFYLDDFAALGANAIMNAYSVFTRIGYANLTQKAISDAFSKSEDAPNFLSQYTYTCNGHQVVGRPAICNNHADVVQYDGHKLVLANDQPIDTSSVIGPPPSS